MSFGRLQRPQAPARPFAEINVTPLVDVLLVLVVILIVTAPLLARAIRLDLPAAAGVSAPPPAAAVVDVSVDAQGRLFLDGQPASRDALAQRLAQVAGQDPQAEVLLRADRQVPYGRVVEVMGLAQAAGLARIGFVAEAKAP